MCTEKAHLFQDISLTRNNIAGRVDEMSGDFKEQLRLHRQNLNILLLQLMRVSTALE